MRHPTTEYLLAYALNALATIGLDEVSTDRSGPVSSNRYHALHDGPLRPFLVAQENLLAQRYPVTSLHQHAKQTLRAAAEGLRGCEADLPPEAMHDQPALDKAKAALRAAQTRMLELDPAVQALCTSVDEQLKALHTEAAATYHTLRSDLQAAVETALGTPINATDAQTIFSACCVADLQTYVDDKGMDHNSLPASFEQAAKDPKAFASIQAHCGVVSARSSQLERVDQRDSKATLKGMRSTLTGVATTLETFATHASEHVATVASKHDMKGLVDGLAALHTGAHHAEQTFEGMLASVHGQAETASSQAQHDVDTMFRSDEGTSEDPNHPLGSAALRS